MNSGILVCRPDEEDYEDCEVEVVTSGRIGRTVPKGATNISRPFSSDADRDRGDDVEDKNTIIAGTYRHYSFSFILNLLIASNPQAILLLN